MNTEQRTPRHYDTPHLMSFLGLSHRVDENRLFCYSEV